MLEAIEQRGYRHDSNIVDGLSDGHLCLKEVARQTLNSLVRTYTIRLRIAQDRSDPEESAEGIQFCESMIALAKDPPSSNLYFAFIGEPKEERSRYVVVACLSSCRIVASRKIFPLVVRGK